MNIEPTDPETPIMRFLERWKFENWLTRRLSFRRADLFEDESEGLPLDEYWQTHNLNPYDLDDIQTRNRHLGFDAQIRSAEDKANIGLVRLWQRPFSPGPRQPHDQCFDQATEVCR